MGTILKCKGLRTFDNEMSNIDGYLTKADNIVIDTPDVAEPRRGVGYYGDALPSSTDRLKQVLVYKDLILRHFGTTLQFDDSNGAFTAFAEAITEPSGTARIKGKESNGNFYFTSNSGIRKISAKTSADIATGSIEKAGGPKALDLEGTLDFTSAGFLPANSKVAYRILWGKRDANGNVVLGAPSSRLVVTNATADVNLAEEISITTLATASITDLSYFFISSANTDYMIWYDKTGSGTAPTASDTFGKTKLKVDISGATTAAEVAVLTADLLSTLEFTVSVVSATITVTSKEAGNNLQDASDSSVTATGFTITVTQQGQIVSGTAANVDLTFTIPSEVTTDYFYQVYRTGVVTVPEGLTLDDIEPGDDHNFLFEDFPSTAEISAKEVTVNDFTPESFREQGAFLYTNPTTGQGILQANEKPPVAKDIELFRNHMFYANTSTFHRLELRVLSVDNFVSGTSGIVIGNGTAAREYTLVGATQVQDITTVADVADSLDGTYFLINSARNERKYYVWFSTSGGAAVDPAVTGRIAVKVDIATGDSAANVALALSSALLATGDFSTSISTATVTVTWAKNGNTDDAADSATPTGFTFAAVTTDGDGEDSASNHVLLSSLASVAQAIDETARSLVKIINKDTSSPVIATYLSGPDDLPGIISLQSKDLQDDSFFVGSLDALGAEFDPTLSQTKTITAISAATTTQITSATHGLSTGDSIYIYNTDSTPTLLGQYTVTVVDPSNFTVPVNVTGAGTTGKWMLADVESDNEVAGNRLYYSKFQQPEAVPLLNYIDIGPKDKAIQRILALRDNLIVMKEDGIYLVTGTSSPFTSRLVDSSVQVVAPDTAAILNNQIYALTSQGVATISESSPYIISTAIEDKILGVANPRYDFELTSFAVSYESDRSYLIALPTTTTDTYATQMFRYNYFTGAWTRWTLETTCGIVNAGDDTLYLGDAAANYLRKERKNDDRTDYADLDFNLSIPTDSVDTGTITLSSAAAVKKGDAVYQLQSVTIYRYNSLLKRLDIDSGLDDTDYFSTLEAVRGDNITQKMNNLNTKLVADDSSGTITATSYSTSFVTLLTEFNTLIGELNAPACDTSIKSYVTYSDYVPFEVLITDVPFSGNTVSVSQDVGFLQGTVIIYQGIEMDIEWAPQHFGDTQMTKQVRDATLMFDQTNFYSGRIGFNSDISQNFEYNSFLARGNGDFGYGDFGSINFGGNGSESPIRRLVPKNKQRCRFLRIRFQHENAREHFKITGITMNPRPVSKRGYR